MKATLNIDRAMVIRVLRDEYPGISDESITMVLNNIKKGSNDIDDAVGSLYLEWIREQARRVKPVTQTKFSFI